MAHDHRQLAIGLNNRCWTLLEMPERSDAEAEEMIHAAHASLWHWQQAGTGVHHQRGEWMVARVYCEVGHAESALRHARRCLELTEQHAADLQDFDHAFAHEVAARAHALAGETGAARDFHARAKAAGGALPDPGDRKVFADQFATGPWYGLDAS